MHDMLYPQNDTEVDTVLPILEVRVPGQLWDDLASGRASHRKKTSERQAKKEKREKMHSKQISP